ncbi:TIGR02679 domain-containing protein [Actinokineospora diospyrosa]|uniref:TIGR02679 family protein n=1 Tax=Actinokineospora diospyrosa TaxID=103728 RepID=A0ABT1IKF5_9PSEU|nr:TIGR02679 domain-containing protein [Actinokineospora diospyrosa]MCP2273133.1 TIGR02679 family protein [Actinokineospora diospyrosa]
MSGIPEDMRAYLLAVELAPVWSALRRRLERNGLSATGVLQVELTYQAAERLSGLLRRTLSAGTVRLNLADLDKALRNSAAARGLVPVVAELTGGAIADTKAANAARMASRQGLWENWESSLIESGLAAAPWVAQWQEGVRRAGLLTRAGELAPVVIRQAMAVLRALSQVVPLGAPLPGAVRRAVPADPAFELAELASRCCADAHALDDGQLTSALVLRAIAEASGESVPSTAARRRELWSSVGVSPDTVSGTLLAWALRPPGDSPWAVMMRARADLGLVTHITLQEWAVARDVNWVSSGDRVHVCENPQIVQAAARAGALGTLLCTSGNPATVARLAIDKLLEETGVAYHGDFDPPGLRIASRLYARGVQPWRFNESDYLEAVQAVAPAITFTGEVPETPWSPGLATAMRTHNVAIHEEAVLERLLPDLANE